MKKRCLINSVVLFLAFYFVSVGGVCAQENAKRILQDAENIFASSPGNVDLDKNKIEKQKTLLEKNLSITETQASIESEEKKKTLLDQLQTVKKQEEVIFVQEELLRKKEEAYQKIISLVEQKLVVVQNVAMRVRDLNVEISRAQADQRNLNLEKKALLARVERVLQEVDLIEQDISAKKILKDIKKMDPQIEASIVLREERVQLSNAEIDQLRKQVALIDIQLSIVEDYISIMKNKLFERIQKQLLVVSPYRFTSIEIVWFWVLLFFLLGFSLVRRKTSSSKKESKCFANSCRRVVNFSSILGWISFLAYYGFSSLGYHELIRNIGIRVLLSILILYGFFVLRKILNRIIVYLFSVGNPEGKTDLDRENPVFAIVNGLVWVILLVFAGFFVLYLWGYQYNQWFIFMDIVHFSFFKIGNLDFTLMLLVKIAAIIWGLNFFSHVFNQFLDRNVYPQTNFDEGMQYSISVFIKYALVFIGIVIGLRILGIGMSTLNVLAGTIGIGIGIGLQEIAKNFISGIILLVERPIKVGDWIDLEGLPGRVEAVKARGTVITTFDNISVVVPNSDFITKRVTNWSYNDKVIRCCISVGVSYGSDVELVKVNLLAAASQVPGVLDFPKPVVYFTQFGDNALVFNLYVWVNEAHNRFEVTSNVHFTIDRLFREKDIVIAFPQRDIHLKTSDVVFELKEKKEG